MNENNLKWLLFGLLLSYLAGCSTLSSSTKSQQPSQPERIVHYLDQPKIKKPVKIDSEELLYQYLLAEVAMQNGQYAISVENLLKVSERLEDSSVAERAARIAIYTKDYEKGLEAILRWIELEPDNLNAHQMAAVLFLNEGHFERAQQHLEQILALSDDEGFMLIANVLGGEKDYDKVLKIMKTLTGAHQGNPYALYAYGHLAAQFERFEAAKHLMSAAIALQPDMVEAIIARARTMTKLGETEQAIKDLARASKNYPDLLGLKVAYGRVLINAKRYDDATEVFQDVLHASPDDDEILYTLALLTLDLERYKQSKQYFSRLLILNRRTDESHYYLGRIAEIQQRYKIAIKYFSRVIKNTYRLESQMRIAIMHSKAGEIEQARDQIRGLRGVYTEPGMIVRTYLVESEIYREDSDFQAALDILSDGLRSYPENKELLYSRSLVAEKLGHLAMVEKDLRLILSHEPDNADALNALGYTLADRTDRIEEAFALIEQAMKLKPNDPAVTDSYGWVLYRMGRYDEAVVHLKRALSLQYDAEIAAHLGEVLWVSGNQSAAKAVWQQALDKIPQHEAVLNVIRRFEE